MNFSIAMVSVTFNPKTKSSGVNAVARPGRPCFNRFPQLRSTGSHHEHTLTREVKPIPPLRLSLSLAGSMALALGGLLLFVIKQGKAIFPTDQLAMLPENLNTQMLGRVLYGPYMLPFEIASLLLLVAIVGAVVMAKKRI